MNSSSAEELSLHQLTQQLINTHQALPITSVTINSILKSLVNVLITKKLMAQLWVKLNDSWLEELELLYEQEDFNRSIYLCLLVQEYGAFTEKNKGQNQYIPLQLIDSHKLRSINFFLILSADFSLLIIIEELSQDNYNLYLVPELKAIQNFYVNLHNSIDIDAENFSLVIDNNFSTENNLGTDILLDLLAEQIKSSYFLSYNEKAIYNAKKKIEQLNKYLQLKDDFIKNLARELKTPITHMKTALSLLSSKKMKKEQRERYLKMLQDQCDRQNTIMGGLSQFNQLEKPSENPLLAETYLIDIIPGIVSTYQPLAQEKGIQLGYTVASGLPPAACPSAWVRQIIINLLNNSLQYTNSDGRVFVEAGLEKNYLKIKVKDTGIGIENQDLPNIFKSFYYGKNNSEFIKGAGLGLTIVQYLTQQCLGSISVKSKPNKGAIVTVWLPIEKDKSILN